MYLSGEETKGKLRGECLTGIPGHANGKTWPAAARRTVAPPEFMSMKIVEVKSKCNLFMSSLTRFRLSDCQLYAVIVIIAYGNYTATLCPLYLPLRSP